MFGFLKLGLKIIITLLLFTFAAGYFIGSSYGSDDFNIDYTITLSDTCIALLKINVTTCPSYDEILTLFPDQTNTDISGHFEYKFGYYHRQPSDYKNQYEYYKYFPIKNLIWTDPPHDVKLNSRNIIIAAASFDYKLKHESINTTHNNTLTVGTNRYVDDKCNDAIITKDNWIFLLGDTVRYMQHDCDEEYTNFDEIKIVEWQRARHNITESYKYQLDKWREQSIAECGKRICIGN